MFVDRLAQLSRLSRLVDRCFSVEQGVDQINPYKSYWGGLIGALNSGLGLKGGWPGGETPSAGGASWTR